MFYSRVIDVPLTRVTYTQNTPLTGSGRSIRFYEWIADCTVLYHEKSTTQCLVSNEEIMNATGCHSGDFLFFFFNKKQQQQQQLNNLVGLFHLFMQNIFGRLGFPESKRLIKFYEESWKAFPPPTALSRLYRVQVNRWDKGWNALAYAGIPSVMTSHFISSDKTADCHWPFVSQGINQSPSLLNSARLKLLHFFCNNNTS